MSGDISDHHDLGWGCYWHPAGRGRGCRQTSHRAHRRRECRGRGSWRGAPLLVMIRAWNLLPFYMVSKHRILGMLRSMKTQG